MLKLIPGDIIVGDDDGVVVIPFDKIEKLWNSQIKNF